MWHTRPASLPLVYDRPIIYMLHIEHFCFKNQSTLKSTLSNGLSYLVFDLAITLVYFCLVNFVAIENDKQELFEKFEHSRTYNPRIGLFVL